MSEISQNEKGELNVNLLFLIYTHLDTSCTD